MHISAFICSLKILALQAIATHGKLGISQVAEMRLSWSFVPPGHYPIEIFSNQPWNRSIRIDAYDKFTASGKEHTDCPSELDEISNFSTVNELSSRQEFFGDVRPKYEWISLL